MTNHTCRPYGVGTCYACDRTAQPEADPADREPTPEQERAWDTREDDLRGHVLADAHSAWLGEDMTPDRP